jgi:UDP-N-acetyl-2-amino-2-deoxyglucuronate dehydrogenase
VAAVDPSDSVGVLDQHFHEARFFTEVERFDRFLEKRRRAGTGIDYLSICSPNYLHDAHVRLALRVRAHAICEKPLVISPWNLDALAALEQEYDRRVYTVLPLRHLPGVQRLKAEFETYLGPPVDVELTYVTRRGPWYHSSWKGDEARSGGLAMNIGIHFFDILRWIFGPVESSDVHLRESSTLRGQLHMRRARVSWKLSVDPKELPEASRKAGKHAYRSMTIGGKQLDLETGAAGLHTEVYRHILAGQGWGIEDARGGVELVWALRDPALR